MFTGIIETVGEIVNVERNGSNKTYTVKSTLSNELKVDQSVAHDGVCLTVVEIKDGAHKVTAIDETLSKTTLSAWSQGRKVNIERCMLNNGRFDGHIVQGHVDTVGEVISITENDGSWVYDIQYENNDHVTVEKGSITVNGISLTCFNSKNNGFTVAIIPYTYENTSMHQLKVGDKVNLEFDIVGKYVQKLLTPNPLKPNP